MNNWHVNMLMLILDDAENMTAMYFYQQLKLLLTL